MAEVAEILESRIPCLCHTWWTRQDRTGNLQALLGGQPKTSLLPPQALPETSGQSLASRAGTAKRNWRKKQTGFGKGPWAQSHMLREFTVSLLQLANAAGRESKVALLSADACTR